MQNLIAKFESATPIIAILRAITPKDALAIGEALLQANIKIIEVPLNSPEALQSIELLAKNFGHDAIIGAGTVLSPAEVLQAKNVGSEIIVSPNINSAVIKRTNELQLLSMPGVFTPTEAFAALEHNAFALKIFPAIMHSPQSIKAMRAVLPAKTKLFIVGGCQADNLAQWQNSGANGFAIGTGIYQPNDSPQIVFGRAKKIIAAYNGTYENAA